MVVIVVVIVIGVVIVFTMFANFICIAIGIVSVVVGVGCFVFHTDSIGLRVHSMGLEAKRPTHYDLGMCSIRKCKA